MISGIQIQIIVLAFVGSCFAACPSNWTSNDASCYHFSHDKETWLGAMLVCKMWDANLVSIETAGEQFFIQRHALENKVDRYWLGASDLDQEGTYIWQSSHQPLTFTNWESGQPNNIHGHQNCMAMQTGAHFAWTDEDCTDEELYVCEAPNIV